MDSITYITEPIEVTVYRTGKIMTMKLNEYNLPVHSDITNTELGRLIWKVTEQKFKFA
jgi:hypothetical protein